MGMLDMILQSGLSGNVLESMAGKSGLNQGQVGDILAKVAPVLLGKANANFKGEQDSSGLVELIKQNDLDSLQNNPDVLANKSKGNAILGELLGSKDESRALASDVGSQLGIDVSSIKNLLPMIAPLVLGGLNKQAGSNLSSNDTGGLTSMLSGFLDQDGDGSITDDLLGMASKFLR